MTPLTLQLRDCTHEQRFDDVSSFVGEDASGSFGLRPGHARFLTVLDFGLARFRVGTGDWHYVALPGAVLYLVGGEIRIITRRFLLDTDYERISEALERQLVAEEHQLERTKSTLRNMEEELLRRVMELGEELP